MIDENVPRRLWVTSETATKEDYESEIASLVWRVMALEDKREELEELVEQLEGLDAARRSDMEKLETELESVRSPSLAERAELPVQSRTELRYVPGPVVKNTKARKAKKAARRAVSLKLRFLVLERAQFRCVYCGRTATDVALEIDHIRPVSAGGETVETNLVAACRECNIGKGAIVGIEIPR